MSTACSRTFFERGSEGNAQVEATLIIPLVVLMIKLGTLLCEKVETSSSEHAAYAQELTEGGRLPAEKILRGRWYIK